MQVPVWHKSLAREMLAQRTTDSVCVHWDSEIEYYQGAKRVGEHFQGRAV